jgi:hypothetical protein
MGGIAMREIMSKGNGSNGTSQRPIRFDGKLFYSVEGLAAFVTPEAAELIWGDEQYTSVLSPATRNADRFGRAVIADQRLHGVMVDDEQGTLYIDVAADYNGNGVADSYVGGVEAHDPDSIDQLAASDASDGIEIHDGGLDEVPYHAVSGRRAVDIAPRSPLVDTGEFRVDNTGPLIIAMPVDPLEYLLEAGNQHAEAQEHATSQAIQARATQETQL